MTENQNNVLPNIFFKINKLYNYQQFQHSDNWNSTLSDFIRSGAVLGAAPNHAGVLISRGVLYALGVYCTEHQPLGRS